MESRNLKKLLFDVEKACKRIEKFVSNCSLDDFLNNEMLQSAVERQSEIIGEALNQALGLDSEMSNRISNISRIIAFPVVVKKVVALAEHIMPSYGQDSAPLESVWRDST
jgi:hypothetical protein